MSIKKYSGTIKVLLNSERLVTDPEAKEVALIGYYQAVSVFSHSEGDAVSILRKSVADGHIHWADSEIIETRVGFADWFRILRGPHVKYASGKAFFPAEERESAKGVTDPIAWRLN